MLDILTAPGQFLNITLFVAGTFILSWCAKVEKKEDDKRHDRKEKWAYIDGRRNEDLKKRSIRGLILTLVGSVMAFYGFISFLAAI